MYLIISANSKVATIDIRPGRGITGLFEYAQLINETGELHRFFIKCSR